MCHFTVVGNGNGFKAFVRMLSDTARTVRFVGCKFIRCGIVQHQEWIGAAVVSHVGEQRLHEESVAYPVLAVGSVDLFDVAHDKVPSFYGRLKSFR